LNGRSPSEGFPEAEPIRALLMSQDFHLEEYRALRAEVLDRIKACHDLEPIAAGAAAAVYAWVGSTQTTLRPTSLILLLPILFAAFGGLRSWFLLCQITALGKYLTEIESRYIGEDDPLIGWEKYRKTKANVGQDFAVQFWWGFLVISLALSVAFYLTLYKGGAPSARPCYAAAFQRVRAVLPASFKVDRPDGPLDHAGCQTGDTLLRFEGRLPLLHISADSVPRNGHLERAHAIPRLAAVFVVRSPVALGLVPRHLRAGPLTDVLL
jgi:hypothetical protein